MKKLFTIIALAGVTFSASSQNMQTAKATVKMPVSESYSLSPVISPSNRTHTSAPNSYKGGIYSGRTINTVIGHTYFSNQTNGSIYRRIQAFKDGKISATWTFAYSGPADSYLKRGSGYNCMKGTSWNTEPTLRVEDRRTGFPAIVVTPDNKEIIFSHLADTGSLSGGYAMTKNLAIGSTVWGSTTIVPGSTPPATYPGALWPRVAVSGDFMIVIANYTDSNSVAVPKHVYKAGVKAPFVYSRYQFSTDTWLTMNATLPGYDSTLYTFGNGDTYNIDSKDSVVAIVQAKVFDDWALWKSTDFGATWTKKVIRRFPIHKYDFKSDTLPRTYCAGEAVSVLIDNNYRIHAFAERNDVSVAEATRQDNIAKNSSGYTYSYMKVAGSGSSGDAILYWNETLATDSIKIAATSAVPSGAQDSSYNFSASNTKWYGISNSTWPSTAIDSAGNMFLVYSAFTVGDADGGLNYYRDILISYSKDGGNSWSNPVNVTSFLGYNVEQVYPSVARYADDNLHITYLAKKVPGTDQSSSDPENYTINHLAVSVKDIMTATGGVIQNVNEKTNELFAVQQNFPNPSNGSTTIPVKLNRVSDVTISVINLVGQNVYSEKFNNAHSGVNNFEINLNKLNSGIYFYTVEAEGFKVTKRMVIE